MRMCHFEKLCTCYCTLEHENLTFAMLILYFIFCLTLPLLIPFIAHTVSLMGHRAVKQERFIVARDEEVWKLWAIYWRWRAVYKSISVDQAGPALAAARLVTDYTSCQLEARSQGAFLLPSPISRPLPLITIMTLDTCHHYWCQPGAAGQLIITHCPCIVSRYSVHHPLKHWNKTFLLVLNSFFRPNRISS